MTARYRLAAGVRWVVNHVSLTVSDGRGNTYTMHYPEGAVWDLFSRGYSFPKVVSLMTHIASLQPGAAEDLVCAAIDEWQKRGLLEPSDSRMIEMRPV